MNTAPLTKFALIAALSIGSQFAAAQNSDNMEAFRQIAAIVATINHFPSDEDMAKLDAITANSSLAQPVREMANTVANIEHSPNEEGRGAMEAIIENAQNPAVKTLAEIIANFSHMASADAKAQLAQFNP